MPDLSPEALSPFLRGSGLVFDHTTRTEVTGTIDVGPYHHTPGESCTAVCTPPPWRAQQASAPHWLSPMSRCSPSACPTRPTSSERTPWGGCTSKPGRSTKGEPASSGSATSPGRTASWSRRDASASRTCRCPRPAPDLRGAAHSRAELRASRKPRRSSRSMPLPPQESHFSLCLRLSGKSRRARCGCGNLQ